MSDLVSELRRAQRLSFDEYIDADRELARLVAAQDKARAVVEALPPGTGRKGGQARARWTTKCEAVKRRRQLLVDAYDTARNMEWS